MEDFNKIAMAITRLGFPIVMALLLGYALFVHQSKDLDKLEMMIEATHQISVDSNTVLKAHLQSAQRVAEAQERMEKSQLRLWRQICLSLSETQTERRICMAE